MKTSEFSIDVTYNCPYSCAFCSSPKNNYLPDMTLDIANKCTLFMESTLTSENTQIEVTITGGEPLTLNKLSLFVSKWSEKGYRVNLCTTAALEMGKDYWRNLFLCGLKTVRLSLHSISNECCQAIFGPKYFFHVVERNIEHIRSAGITLIVNYLLTRLNANSFDEVCDYCYRKSINKIRILGLCKQGRAVEQWDQLSLSQEKQSPIIEHISKLATNCGSDIEFAGVPKHKLCTHADQNGKCLGGKSFFHINANGDIYACPSVKAIPSEKIGSVLSPTEISERKTIHPCLKNHSRF